MNIMVDQDDEDDAEWDPVGDARRAALARGHIWETDTDFYFCDTGVQWGVVPPPYMTTWLYRTGTDDPLELTQNFSPDGSPVGPIILTYEGSPVGPVDIESPLFDLLRTYQQSEQLQELVQRTIRWEYERYVGTARRGRDGHLYSTT